MADNNVNKANVLAHRENRTERIERFQALQPGTYWRPIHLEALEGEIHTDHFVPAGGHQPPAIDPGVFDPETVYLLKRIEYADGEPHTVQVLDHPTATNNRGGPGTYHIRLQPFLAAFEYAPDGEAVREREIAGVQTRIEEKRTEVDRIAADPSYVMGLLTDGAEGDEAEAADTDSGELDAEAGLPESDAGSRSIATAAEADRALMKRQLNNSRVIAKAQKNLLQARTSELESTLQALTPFYNERAEAAKASVSDVMDQVERIEQGLMTLGLYTGDGVEVIHHVDGDGADPDEPLTLRQRLLYMDEESLINVAEGGADFRDLDTFVQQLGDDPALRERVIPESRAVVAMQYRRERKNYGEADPAVAFSLNERNTKAFLLVRDGERFYTVHSPLETLTRLFPTNDEADAPFRGIDGESIRIDDVRYPKAKHASEMVSLHYKRLLILLWGLYDREDLFGRFRLEERGHLNILSADVQNAVFRFVYDDEALLGDQEERPAFLDFVKAKNRYLQSGSRVACAWRELITSDTAPSCAKAHRVGGDYRDHVRYRPTDGQEVMIAESRKGDLCVRPEVAENFGDRDDKRFHATVWLQPSEYYLSSRAYICLDDVRPEDLDWYVHSRRERQAYLDNIPLLVAARNALQRERPTIDVFMTAVRETLAQAGLELPDDRATADTIHDAIRAWRASKRGALPPMPGEDGHRRALEQVVEQLWWQYADAGRQRIADAETLCANEGRQPLRLVVNGQGRLYLYAGPRDDEREARVGEHVWVQRQTLTARKKKFSVDNRSWRQMPAFDPAERVIAEWDEAAYWAAFGTLPYAYHDVAVAIEACRRGREWLTRALTDGIDNAEWHKRLMDLDEGERRLSRDRQVFIPSITIPVGILRNEDERRRPVGLCTLHFDQLRLLHRIAGDEQRERLNRWIHTHYYWSDERIEELDNEGPLTVAFNVGRFTSAEIGRVRDGATPDAPEHYFRGHNIARERGDLRALLTGERYGEEKPKPGDERYFPIPTETDVARVARTHWPVGGLPAESAEALDEVLLDRDE